MIDTSRENTLQMSLKMRLEGNYSQEITRMFWIEYSKHKSADVTYESMCRTFFKVAELCGIQESFIQDTIDDCHKYFIDRTEEIKQNIQARSLLYQIDKYQENILQLYDLTPFFYDRNGIFWVWESKESKYKIVDEVDVMNSIDHILGLQGQTVSNKHRGAYLEAFRRVGRNKIPSPAPVRWIQFKDKAYSLRSGNIYEVKPNYFFTNPIPHKIGLKSDTPIFDKLFSEWVTPQEINLLYEIISYCCYQSYPIQCLFSLYGGGRNGKSTFLRIVQKFLGQDNICSTELDLITGNNSSRFETAKLYKKLACFMGETNFSMMTKSGILKKLTGGDMIGYEMKNKQPFDDYNYSKILIASNTLPTTEDTSDGFYRRWVIIDFPNQFQEGKDILKDIPEEEYENLSRKVIEILPSLIERGYFVGHQDPGERKNKYIMASNPLPQFIKDFCIEDVNGYIRYGELYNEYVKYLNKNKKRVILKKEFSRLLPLENLEIQRTTKKEISEQSDVYVLGIKWNENVRNVRNVQDSTQLSHTSYRMGIRTYRTLGTFFEIKCPFSPCSFEELKELNPLFSEQKLENAIKHAIKCGDILENPSGYFQALK